MAAIWSRSTAPGTRGGSDASTKNPKSGALKHEVGKQVFRTGRKKSTNRFQQVLDFIQ